MKPFRATALLLLSTAVTFPAAAAPDNGNDALTATITDLDSVVFDAYNRCDMDTFGRYFSPTVEFYHDTGGATFDRATVLANTQKYICNKVRRELVPGTLKVYPIKDFGAIEEGEHRFCELASGKCEGSARFVMVWRLQDGQWQMTRVLSYGHRTLTPAEQAQLERAPAR